MSVSQLPPCRVPQLVPWWALGMSFSKRAVRPPVSSAVGVLEQGFAFVRFPWCRWNSNTQTRRALLMRDHFVSTVAFPPPFIWRGWKTKFSPPCTPGCRLQSVRPVRKRCPSQGCTAGSASAAGPRMCRRGCQDQKRIRNDFLWESVHITGWVWTPPVV